MPVSALAFGHGAPGRVFRLPEEEVLARVKRLARQREPDVELIESVNQYVVRRGRRAESSDLLGNLYEPASTQEAIYA